MRVIALVLMVLLLNIGFGVALSPLKRSRLHGNSLKFAVAKNSLMLGSEFKRPKSVQFIAQLSPDAVAQQFRRDSVGLLSAIKYQLTAVPSIILSTLFGVHLHSGKLSNIALSLASVFGFGQGLMAMSIFGTTSILAIELTKMLADFLSNTWKSSSSLFRLVGILFRRG